MKLLGSFFGDREQTDKKALAWNTLQEEQQLEAIRMESFQAHVLLYKHSTRCGISSVTLNRLNRNEALSESGISFYFLDLIRFRGVSQKIADTFGIPHESPQVLLLSRGEVIYHASHMEIAPSAILKQLG